MAEPISPLVALSAGVVPDGDRLELRSEPGLDNILLALNVLHATASNPNERLFASKYLTAVQSSPFAWKLADEMLAQRPDIHCTYFAAQTFKLKIRTSFSSELRPEQYESLRNMLVAHLNQIASSETNNASDHQQVRTIVNQLCTALTYLTILDASWQDPLISLMNGVKDPSAKLQILTYVPEEVVECNSNSHMGGDEEGQQNRLRGVGNNRRREVIKYLASASGYTIQLLTQMAEELESSRTASESSNNNNNENHRERSMIFRAFASWTQVLFTSDHKPDNQQQPVASHKIEELMKKLNICFPLFRILITTQADITAEDDEHDSSADALSALVSCFFNSEPVQDIACDVISGSTSISKLTAEQLQLLAAARVMVTDMLSLESSYSQTIETEEIDKSINIIRIFAETADVSLDLLIALIATSEIGHSTIQINPLDMTPNAVEACKSDLMRITLLTLDFMKRHYDVDVAETAFSFFHKFSDSLYTLVCKNQPGTNPGTHLYSDAPSKVSVMAGKNTSTIMSHADCLAKVQKFGLFVAESLIEGLRKHSQLEPDEESVLPIESEQRDFRTRVKELLQDFAFLIGAGNLVSHLTIKFLTQGNCWEDVEVDLFFACCLVRELFDRTGQSIHDDVIHRLIDGIFSITTIRNPNRQVIDLNHETHPQILATSCDTLANLAVWLKKWTLFLPDVLTFIFLVIQTSKLKKPDLMTAATAALEPIVETCFVPQEGDSTGHVDPVKMPDVAAEKLVAALIDICSELDSLPNEESEHHLLQSASNLISSLGSGTNESPDIVRNKQEVLICQLLAPHSKRLQHEMLAGSSDLTQDLDRITSLFRPLKLVPCSSSVQSLAPNSPLTHVIDQELWPLIRSVLETYALKSDRVIERACRTLRYILRSVRPVFLIVPVAEKICSLFIETKGRHSSFLYISSILVDEFVPANDHHQQQGEEIAEGMMRLLSAVSTTTFSFLTSPGVRIRDHPDTIDDFYRLCMRYIQKRPEKFISCKLESGSSILVPVLELSLVSLDIDQQEASHSVTKFLVEFIESLIKHSCEAQPLGSTASSGYGSVSSVNGTPPAVTRPIDEAKAFVIQDFGPKLTDRLLSAVLFSLPSYFIPEFADVVFSLLLLHRERAYDWFKGFFTGSGITEAVATAGTEQSVQMQQQLQSNFESLVNAKNAKSVAQSIRNLHRLFRSK